MSRKTFAALPAAMAAVLLIAAAPVAADVDIVEVRIHVSQIGPDVELGWVNPGDTLVLPPNTRVRLRIEAVPRHRGGRYPGADYELTGGVARSEGRRVVVRAGNDGRLVAGLENAKPERGSVVLQTHGRDGHSVVRYTLIDTIEGLQVPDELRSSAFNLVVEHGAAIVPVGEEPATVDLDDARQAVTELYRGILLREPDAEGLAAYSDGVRARGWAGLAETAVEIAKSEESRIAVYQRGTTYEQRLAALYEHLLGVEPTAIDRDQWREDLERLRAGEIDRVVEEVALSETFRDRFGFEAPTARRYAVPRR